MQIDSSHLHRQRRDWLLALLPALPMAVAALVLTRLGAYPTNDDYLYGRSVALWVEQGRFVRVSLDGLVCPVAVTHIALGAFLSKLLGFSYSLLHGSVQLQATAGAVALYLASRSVGCTRGVSLLLALSFAMQPFVFGNAFTYMTDGPGVAWMALGLFGYLHGIRRSSAGWLLAGSAATAWGTLTRQTAVGIVIFPVVYFLGRAIATRRFRSCSSALLLVATLPALALLLVFTGVFDTASVVRGYTGSGRAFDLEEIRHAALNAYAGGILAGFFTLPALPLLLSLLVRQARRGSGCCRWLVALGSLPGALLLIAFLSTQGRAYLTNATGPFMQNAHFGPILLSDAIDPGRWGDMGGVVWPVLLWQTLTVLAIGNVMLLGATIATTLIGSADSPSPAAPDDIWLGHGLTAQILLMALGLWLVHETVLEETFDRHWMPLIVPLYGWLALRLGRLSVDSFGRRAWSAALLLALGMAWMSVAFTHDFLAFNQACWHITAEWEHEGLRPEQIHGGYAYNGWIRSATDPATHSRKIDEGHRWWSGEATRFLAVGPRDGFSVLSRQPWRSWATGCEHTVLGLIRSGSHSGAQPLSESGTDTEAR